MKLPQVIFVISLASALASPAFAGPAWWDIDGATPGGSGTASANGVWDQNSTANWSSSALGDVPTDTFFNVGGATPDAIFSAGSDVTGLSLVTIDGSVSANSITIKDGRVTFSGTNTPVLTLGGGPGAGLTITSTAAGNSGFDQTVTSLVLASDQVWNVADGITFSTVATLFTGNTTTTAISGNFGITINADPLSNGTVSLGDDLGASTFTGGVTVKGGTFAVNAQSVDGNSSAGTGTITLGDTTGSRDVTLTIVSNANRIINNAIVIEGGSTGNAITILHTGSNSPQFTGGITLNHDLVFQTTLGGSLNFTGANGIVTNGFTMIANSASTGATNFDAEITGTGGLIVNGRARLGGTNTSWSGAISVAADGILTASTAASSGANSLGSGAISLANGATLIFASNNGDGSNYQNGTVTIASGTANVNFTGSSARRRIVGGFDLGTSGVGATLAIDPGIQIAGSSGVRLFGDSTIQVTESTNANSTFNVYGGVSSVGGAYDLTKTGSGTLTLGATITAAGNVPLLTGVASTYGGDTNIAAGSIRVGQANALPTGTTVAVASGAVLDLSSSATGITTQNYDQTIAGLNNYGGTGGTVTANSTTTNLNTTRILTLSGGANYEFSGNLVNATGIGNGVLALAKTGAGTQSLRGTGNTYSGGTMISMGTLLANNASGSATGTGTVGVSGTGTLGGGGTVTGAVTVENGATLRGGDGFSTSATLKASGGVSLLDGSTIALTLGTGGVTDHSSIDFTGGAVSFDSDQVFRFNTLAAGTYTFDNILVAVGADPDTSLWDALSLNPNVASAIFTYDGANVDLSITFIPEPATGVLLLGGLGVLMAVRRRG